MAVPSGTVTFLFTDIEGSTRLWQAAPDAMRQGLERHDAIVRDAIEAHGGYVFSTGGDGFAAAFARAGEAVEAAIEAQRALGAEPWSESAPLLVRMGVHTGEVTERDGDYFGPPLNRCARLMASGHGGQILCSTVTAALVSGQLPGGLTLRDLGIVRLRDLSEPEHVFQLDHEQLRAEFPALRSLDSYRSNLPSQSTAFVGRDDEVRDIAKTLAEARVVTLCGVGGVGKTRLALQVGAHVLPQFADGAWLVELASIGSAEAVEEAVAAVFGLQPAPGQTIDQSVLDYLAKKSLLLILDNCEHLLNAVAHFVETALRCSPGLTVLATSREGLAVSGERLLTVPSLQTPDSTMTIEDLLVTEAVRLFVQRAQDARSSFATEDEEAATVGELCRRLDGIPLAIELAAARVRVLSPKEILDHLDQRFKLLTAGRRTAVTRHQTLQSTLDWSYELLDDSERMVFRRLASFVGDLDLAAAEAVAAGDDLEGFTVDDLLFRLVEKSLVVAVTGPTTTRYRLLETIRDYASDRLLESGEHEGVSQRHGRYFLLLAEELGPGLQGPEEVAHKARIEQDLDNLRTALRWAIDAGDADAALRLVDALSNAGAIRSPYGTLPLEAAKMPQATGHPLVPVALASGAAALSAQGDNEQALAIAEAAVEAAEEGRGTPIGNRALGHTYSNVAMVGQMAGRTERFREMAEIWLEVGRALNDDHETSQALNIIGSLLVDEREAIKACERSLELARRLGAPSRIAYASIALGSRLITVDVERAERVLTEAVSAATAVGNGWIDQWGATNLGLLRAGKGDLIGATSTMVEITERGLRRGDHFSVGISIGQIGLLLAALDEPSGLLLGAWSEHHKTLGLSSPVLAWIASSYTEQWNRLADSERAELIEKAAGLSAAELLSTARECLDRLIGTRTEIESA